MTAQTLPELSDARFEVLDVLGEGGMATVYKAVDRHTQELCAIKVLHPRYVDKPKIRQRFAAEAQAMMRLKHRNVIQVLAVRTDVLQPWFAMELAEGGCVVEWLARYGKMPPKLAVDLMIQVCKGLGAAHRQGVIHRDIKPHNLLVTRRGVCKITDFGIAQIEDDAAGLTRTGSVMGTLGYIAPEQRANAKDVDPRSDVYSVGATLFTLLTARTTMDLFFADQDPQMLDGVQDALRPVLLKATRYRREDRHASVRDLAKELYHVKPLLPEDPPDTPPIVMHVDPLPGDDELGPSDATGETPFSDLVTPATPTGDPLGAPETFDSGGSTTPGIDRSRLLRDRDAAGPREGWMGVVVGMATALGVAFLAVALATAVAVSGRAALLAEHGRLVEAEIALEQVLTAESEVVAELAGLGAPPTELEARWSAWQGASGRERDAKVGELVRAYRNLLDAHEPAEGTSRVHLARKAAGRLEKIEGALQAADAQAAVVDAAGSSFSARLAAGMGLL